MKLKPLMELSNMEETSDAIKEIVNDQRINSVYKTSIEKMLELTLWLLVGYYRYYEENRYKRLSLGALPLEWNDLSEDLEELINPDDDRSFLPDTTMILDRYPNMISKRVYRMGFLIGGDLFEDFDEDGYRNGYVQQVGRYGEECGRNLIKILPAGLDENPLITEYKISLLILADYLRNI